jgi:putative alpha-1,2-mannosidase
MGLFDIEGGAGVEPRYEITAPLFRRVRIELDGRYYKGREVVIRAEGEGSYIQKAEWNGKRLEGRYWITHKEFAGGGELRVWLGEKAERGWGR